MLQLFFFLPLSDYEGNIYFNDLLFATLKRVFGTEIFNNTSKENKAILDIQENKTKQKIEHKTKKLINLFYKESQYHRKEKREKGEKIISKEHESDKQNVNPIITILFVGMAYKSWKKFTERKGNNELLSNDSLPLIGLSLYIIFFFKK